MGMHDHTLIAGSKTQVLWAHAVLAVCNASLGNRVSHTDTSACASLALTPVWVPQQYLFARFLSGFPPNGRTKRVPLLLRGCWGNYEYLPRKPKERGARFRT